jgi:nitrate reductase molybdenum cofactor assembly chaperone
MSHIPKVLDAFARLLSYPDEHTTQSVELLYVVLQSELPDAALSASQFGAFCERHERWEIEEAFTRTFDVNPACALEVGWHLFGEEYARGMFLVRMRQELRKYGLSESSELPDHIAHVLAIVAAMPEAEATRFVRACVQPAIETMNRALTDQDTPYRHVVASLAAVIEQRWGPCAVEGPDVLASRANGLDPLRAFPVADAGCGSGCGGSCDGNADGNADGDVEVVPLNSSFPTINKPTNSAATIAEDRS